MVWPFLILCIIHSPEFLEDAAHHGRPTNEMTMGTTTWSATVNRAFAVFGAPFLNLQNG